MSLQLEWQYICRAIPGVGEMLRPVENAIKGGFIPVLLDIQPGELTPTLRRLLGHGDKQGGMNLRNPVNSAARMRQASVNDSKVLVASLLGGEEQLQAAHPISVQAAPMSTSSNPQCPGMSANGTSATTRTSAG